MQMQFRIPMRMPSLNEYIDAERTSRYKAAAMKSEWMFIVQGFARKELGGVKLCEPVHIDYTWTEKNRKRDLDNISSFGRKVIQDALVAGGWLSGDGWGQISGFSDSFAVDGKHPGVTVTIREEA